MIVSPTTANRPKTPYFFLQKFKRSLGDDHDLEGQMLAAMILAQELNHDDRPIYGCWLQGKNWNLENLATPTDQLSYISTTYFCITNSPSPMRSQSPLRSKIVMVSSFFSFRTTP